MDSSDMRMDDDEDEATLRKEAISIIKEVFDPYFLLDDSLIEKVIKWLREGWTREKIKKKLRQDIKKPDNKPKPPQPDPTR